MPQPSEILATLGQTAGDGLALAVLWHVLMTLALVSLLRGWRPTQRGSALMLLPLLGSVSLLALLHGSYFNAAVAAALVLALAAVAWRWAPRALSAGPPWSQIAGAAMLGFGWCYPHFLGPSSWLVYLVAAPTGLLPCPTLSVLIGASLLARGFESRAWSLVLSAAGLFYAIFGALRLEVRMDFALGWGSTLLALGALLPRQLGWALEPAAQRQRSTARAQV